MPMNTRKLDKEWNLKKIDAIDQKIDMCIRSGWQCFRCKRHLSLNEAQLAHRIPKAKRYLKKYGPEIIHHPLNMRISCADCNSYALIDPATHPIEANELIDKIKEHLIWDGIVTQE